ncbi:VWA domain-containing protein [Actinoplanes sp. NPDC049265]|uniref:VWA domain-containing protein n=1 Tax=Actinoplanes sp. NPDC049265 TaxID=3363902 RepID=UPI003718F4BD
MAKHRAGWGFDRWVLPAVGVAAVAGLAVAGGVAALGGDGAERAGNTTRLGCANPVRVVTASSFAPVLNALRPQLDNGDACVRVELTVADGRAAIAKAEEVGADVWIPDDAAWAGSAGRLNLAQPPLAGAGATLATSPLYMVTDDATGAKIQARGGGWLALSQLADQDRAVRLVIRDPQSSGDGMLGAGAPAEAVWLAKDMDASALWLSRARHRTRIVTGDETAMPVTPGEVGVVPEYALRKALGDGAARPAILPGTDHAAMLRFTWFPLAQALTDPARSAAIERLRLRLTRAESQIQTAGLRTPGQARAAIGSLPAPSAEPLGVLAAHNVDHVFATWYPADRRTDLLVVVDVSGSMAAATPGSRQSRIALVREGVQSIGGLLPDDSRMGLWEFGSELDGGRDYKQLLAVGGLTGSHRRELRAAVGKLTAQETGTGLYDTILAAYRTAQDSYRSGVPNQVLVFTDGKNESDEKSLTAAQLATALGKAADPRRPVLLSVVTFGDAGEAKVVENALGPVAGYVDVLRSADEVSAVFIHVAAGGLHH